MNFKQHRNYGITIALLASIGYCVFFTGLWFYQSGTVAFSSTLLEYCLGLFLVCFAGSLAPDLDIDSIPSKWVARFLALCWASILLSDLIFNFIELEYELQWKPFAIMTIVFLIAKSGKHRGITHALAWVPVLMVVSIFTENHFIGAFSVGLAVHYYCDSINPLILKNWF